jgi:signal transduction histidine kinase
MITVAPRRYLGWVDEGPGVPPEQREEIFEPLYPASPERSGVGPGLNLVKQIVQRHGGAVSIMPGDRGAHFRVGL